MKGHQRGAIPSEGRMSVIFHPLGSSRAMQEGIEIGIGRLCAHQAV